MWLDSMNPLRRGELSTLGLKPFDSSCIKEWGNCRWIGSQVVNGEIVTVVEEYDVVLLNGSPSKVWNVRPLSVTLGIKWFWLTFGDGWAYLTEIPVFLRDV